MKVLVNPVLTEIRVIHEVVRKVLSCDIKNE